MLFEFGAPLLALLTSAACGRVLLHYGLLPMDLPNQRSSHGRPVPRAGGLAIWAGWGAALLAAGASGNWILPGFVLAAISYADDRRGLPVAWRLTVHLIAAAAFVLTSLPLTHWTLQTALVLAIIWMLNLFNFMDGSDGLAASVAFLGFASYAIVALGAEDRNFFTVTASLAAACLAFLWLNWSPARVFMGDTGSVPLGFLAAALGVEGWSRGLWASWFPVLVFLPFIADATLTIGKRAARGARVWEAHREHAYQSLLLLGWRHGRVATCYAAFMLGCCASAILCNRLAPDRGLAALLAWGTLLGLGYWWVAGLVRRRDGVSDAR